MATLADRLALRTAKGERREWLPALMIGTAVIAVLAVIGLLAAILWLSVTTGNPNDPALIYTLEHYREIYLEKFTFTVIGNTLLFSGVTLVVALAVALPMAWLIERTDFPRKSVVFTCLTIGLLVPGFSTALGWLFLLSPRVGLINLWLIDLFGLEDAPFNVSTLFGMGVVQGLALAPITFIMTAIVFRQMDSALEEAAAMGGANLWSRLRRVTLPLAWPGVLAASIYVFTIGFTAFDVPAVLGYNYRIFTFSTYVFYQVNPTEALPAYHNVAALSMVMIVLAVLMSWWYGAMQRKAPRFAVVTGKAYRPNQVKLGRWKPLAVAFVVAYFTAAQLLPVLTLVWGAGLPFLQPLSLAAMEMMSFANFTSLPSGLVERGMKNTAILMVLVPTITVFLSLGVSWVVLRSKLKGRAVFDFFAFLPHTVPTIVFAVSAWMIALFVLRDRVPIYGTIWILVVVYVVAQLSYGTRMTNSALIQLHKDLEESAMISGAGMGGVMRAILIPLLAPAMLYSWMWMALLSYRELTMPVVLSTVNNQPLSVVVWGFVSGSQYGKASAVALIMVGLMVPILILYWTIARRTGLAPRG
jgi:iron(III) transport system permease protein